MKKTILSLALVLASSSLAFGSIVITEGINNSAGRSPVVFSGAGTSIVDQVIGRTAEGLLVTFDSPNVLKASGSTVEASGVTSEFTDLTFFSVGNSFTSVDFVLNFVKLNGNGNDEKKGNGDVKDQTITFTVDYIQGVDPYSKSFTYKPVGHADFPYTIQGTAGEQILKVSFLTTSQTTSLKDLHIGGLNPMQQNDPGAVPEPLSMSMLGSGLLGLAFYSRKRRVR